MALRFQSVFKSKDGNTYAINIYDPTYSGAVSQLIPADEPFVTREDDDDNVFAPMRAQTGYIRIIDTDNEIFNSILPPNNTHLLVRVYRGTWDGSTFTPASNVPIQWQGFVKSQVYTQPWTEHKTILELPVVSLLGALQYMFLPVDGSATVNLFELLREINSIIKTKQGLSSDVLRGMYQCTDQGNISGVYAHRDAFLEKKQIKDVYSADVTITQGISFYEVLSRWALLLGVTWREKGDTFVLQNMARYYGFYALYDNGMHIIFYNLSGSQLTNTRQTLVDFANNQPTFAGADNDVSIMQGKRSVQLAFQLQDMSPIDFALPKAPETPAQEYTLNTWVFQVEQFHSGTWVGDRLVYGTTFDKTLKVMFYTPQSGNGVVYSYVKRIGRDSSAWTGTTEAVIGTSYMILQNLNAWGNGDAHQNPSILYCGAIPIRYSLNDYDRGQGEIKQAHLFNIWPEYYHDVFRDDLAAELMRFSQANVSTQAGQYFNIHMRCIPLFNEHFPDASRYPESEGYNRPPNPVEYGLRDDMHELKLKVALKCGDQYWDDHSYSWVDGYACFEIVFDKNGNIISNYEPAMGVTSNGGWYVRMPDSSGNKTIEFTIANCLWMETTYHYIPELDPTHVVGDIQPVDAHTVIIEGLSVGILSPASFGNRSTNENVYYKEIINDGFEDSEEVTLDLGTNNNNRNSNNVLINLYDTATIETLPYTKRIDYTQSTPTYETIYVRPEEMTLYMMAHYFEQIRRICVGRIFKSADWMMSVWKYANRFFYGIIAEYDWKKNEETVKFIETNHSIIE